jgi:xanthine/CO dehydrogenase XdhC/CoxF family maturation factor
MDFLRLCSAERQPGIMATVISSPSPDAGIPGDRWSLKPNGLSDGTINDMMVRDWTEAEADVALAQMQSRLLTIPHSLGPVEVFVEVIAPPVSLVLFGAGHDAVPLVRLAKEIGWQVTRRQWRSFTRMALS